MSKCLTLDFAEDEVYSQNRIGVILNDTIYILTLSFLIKWSINRGEIMERSVPIDNRK